MFVADAGSDDQVALLPLMSEKSALAAVVRLEKLTLLRSSPLKLAFASRDQLKLAESSGPGRRNVLPVKSCPSNQPLLKFVPIKLAPVVGVLMSLASFRLA